MTTEYGGERLDLRASMWQETGEKWVMKKLLNCYFLHIWCCSDDHNKHENDGWDLQHAVEKY